MEKEKTQNTAYVPTKCRVTKPPPPKPATNPMQFVAVRPSPLLIKAQQQIKKVEVVKEARQERNEEAEDWQSNLDNWKSCRRKRQEHIIERVEEVKKLELEEKDRGRRRGTTFSEILEKRNKGRFNIPIYDNDSNDLSDYGIGSSSSKTNSVKDADTDDNSSILDEKENSCDEATTPTSTQLNKDDNDEYEEARSEQIDKKEAPVKAVISNEQYTYEGAIEDYRSRIRSKISVNEPVFAKLESSKSKEFAEAQSLLPKGNLFERKKLFETNLNEAAVPKHVQEDLMNAQSIKERLQSLEKCSAAEQMALATKNKPDDSLVGNLKSRLTQFSDPEAKNTPKSEFAKLEDDFEATHSNGYDLYLDKMKGAHYDALYMKSEPDMNGFPPSTTSSSDLVASSDREDSGIHTADVSCSVSQSDEPVEDGDIAVQESPNFKAITARFLSSEKEFADRTFAPCVVVAPKIVEAIVHSPLVEHIAESIQQETLNNVDENVYAFDEVISDDIFTTPLSPQLKPPTEKPPPPPPLNGENDLNANSISPSIRIKKELLIKRSSFLGLEESVVNEQLEALEIQEQEKQKETNELQEQQLKTLNDEEELMKIEREIIEMIEKEEKFKDHDLEIIHADCEVNSTPSDIYLGNKKFDEPFYPEPCYNDLEDQDSEVLKVEHELLQLEQEELKRKRDQLLFQERSAKLSQQPYSNNTYENIYYNNYAKHLETRKSMPDLKNLPPPHQQQVQHNRPVPSYQKSPTRHDYYAVGIPVNHRKSMPDLDLDRTMKSAFTPTSVNNLLMPIKPLKPIDKKDRYMCQQPMESDAYMPGRGQQPRQSMPNLRSRSIPREPWIQPQPKANPQAKSYNQHWLYQEAELRRLADQQKAAAMQRHNQQNQQNSEPKRIINEIKSPKRSVAVAPISQKDYVNLPFLGRQSSYGHALPMSGVGVEGQEVILSVSGKKKCSYCSNELGRGAAMIIESLSLFYHMECFKCCVCHMELGDGMMGTDVRVRNQKLHCHNCYSSDDGIKFSCV